MAWRPTQYLIEGELDNTTPGKVTGWMQFAGLSEKVTFDLEGNFHRDIRGAKIRLYGDGNHDLAKAASYMDGFSTHQTGRVGDMTAGLPPHDYGRLPYFEWYGEDNGRIVVEPAPDCIKILGRPIPACESDPISRQQQALNMANFLAGVSRELGVVAIAPRQQLISDPTFTHWVVVENQVIGEARNIEPDRNGTCFAYVRLFNMPECAEQGTIERKFLQEKAAGLPNIAAAADDITGEVHP